MRTFSISPNEFQTTEPPSGTLLWIGEREAAGFCDAYQYCEASVAQLAFRLTLEHACFRPASDARNIIVARVDRTPILSEEIQPVARRHDGAQWLAIEGPLCGGATRRVLNQPFNEHCYLHQWRETLPYWLTRGCNVSSTFKPVINKGLSLAIIADDYEVASSLMDLAESYGCTSAWFRSPHPSRMRNFDVVWWDDSVVTAATIERWRQIQRLERSSEFRRESTHVWLTNSTCLSKIENARAAGFASVATKPFRIDTLIETLCVGQPKEHARSTIGMLQQRSAA